MQAWVYSVCVAVKDTVNWLPLMEVLFVVCLAKVGKHIIKLYLFLCRVYDTYLLKVFPIYREF